VATVYITLAINAIGNSPNTAKPMRGHNWFNRINPDTITL
jgi:hypothetical protein